MVDQIRFFAGAARMLEGRAAGEYMAGHTSLHPARADRRVRAGHAVELPDDDGGLEVRAGDRRRQHGRAQAVGHHAGRPRCCWPRSRPSSCRPACFNVVCGDRDTGGRWSRTTTPQMVSITGTVRAGMEVAAAAAGDLKRVHLELGGKAPVIVFDDADVDAAAEGIAIAGYFNAGQDCTAATRVLAGPRVYDDFVAALAEQATGTDDRRPRRRGRDLRPAQQRQPARPGQRLRRPHCPTTPRSRTGGAPGRRPRATSTRRPSSPACSRTTR